MEQSWYLKLNVLPPSTVFLRSGTEQFSPFWALKDAQHGSYGRSDEEIKEAVCVWLA
jgi:hypothetical protein